MSDKKDEPNPREQDKAVLKEKLRNKLKQKRMGRSNAVARKKELDGYIKEMGLSQGDMEALKELSEKIIKTKTK